MYEVIVVLYWIVGIICVCKVVKVCGVVFFVIVWIKKGEGLVRERFYIN